MGDSEPIVAQSATVMDYKSSSDHVAVNSNATDAATGMDTNPSGYGGNSDAENCHIDQISAAQEASVASSEEMRPSDGVEDGNQGNNGGESMSVASIQASQASAYDTSTNGVIGSNANGDTSTDAQVNEAAQQLEDGAVLSAEEERLWSIVKANSLDFNAWTSLIEETEKTSVDSIFKIRKVYDAFLAEFPLCYGYWKKYADHEARFGAIDKVVEVYERAVQGVTYSVDIWLHYCAFAISTYGDPETIRRLFERALVYVGTDYLSYPLWDKYIEYEYTQQEWGRLAMIYTRILENPNQQLDRYFTSFKELAGSRPLSELRSPEEAAVLGANEAGPGSNAEAQGTEKEVHTDATDESSKPVSAGLTEAEELDKYIASREEIYRKAKELDSKISGFETAIRRPYFHVRPLNDAELENWHNYLDFTERDGDFNKIVKLYERCLVACANYPEFWIRYILCMEASGSNELAENALARATQVFVKRQPEIHLFAARFREQHSDIPGARAAYQLVHAEISPGLVEAIIDHANMERRLGNMDDAFSLYEQAIAIEKGKEHSQTLPMLFAQYSRFAYLACGNAEKARDILVGALENVQLSKPLLEALIHLESIQSRPKQIDYIDSLVEKFIAPGSDQADAAGVLEREELSSIFLEFLGLFGDVQSIKKAKDRHARLFLRHRSSSESRKRNADDYLSSDKSKLVKSSAAPSVMGTYATAQNQWVAGYGSQPHAWPQTTQAPAQAQPYNPGYAQQAAAYSGYYGATYPPQQVAASVPQTAAYGAYPSPTYPAQAYPNQTYVAPVAAAAPAPAPAPVPAPAPAVQQPAAAPQAYYTSGYY